LYPLSVFLKLHKRGQQTVVGVCDKVCLNEIYKSGSYRFHVSEAFFKGELVSIDEAFDVLSQSDNFNAVGPNIVGKLIAEKIIHPDGIITIDGIPIAIRMLF